MELKMTPVGWSGDGEIDLTQEKHITQYQVNGLRGNAKVFIRAITTAQEGQTSAIIRGEKSSDKYVTADEAFEALKTEES